MSARTATEKLPLPPGPVTSFPMHLACARPITNHAHLITNSVCAMETASRKTVWQARIVALSVFDPYVTGVARTEQVVVSGPALWILVTGWPRGERAVRADAVPARLGRRVRGYGDRHVLPAAGSRLLRCPARVPRPRIPIAAAGDAAGDVVLVAVR